MRDLETWPAHQPAIRSLLSAIHLAVATVLLAILIRTWLVMGLVEPVTVAGSSMAPTLRGAFARANCPSCHTQFDVGAEFAERTEYAACPQCGLARVPLAALPLHRGDRLWIDRTAWHWRTPRRWEVVVLRQPEDGSQLCIKRVVALPGETVWLSGGEVWVNGKIAVKPLADQYAMRQLVDRGTTPQRWKAETAHAWHWAKGAWQHTPKERGKLDWLRYSRKNRKPITDEVAYNAGLSRKLNRVCDLMLSANLRVRGEGVFVLESHDGQQTTRVTIRPSDGSLRLGNLKKNLWSGFLSPTASQQIRQGKVQLVFSNFDRQLLLAINGRVELLYPLSTDAPPAGTAPPFAIGVQGLAASLDTLTLYRDVYHGRHAVGMRPPTPDVPTQLAENEYFVLGDNGPISIDSRVWGPVPEHLLLGKPWGGRSSRYLSSDPFKQ